jgi:hypothetical protein
MGFHAANADGGNLSDDVKCGLVAGVVSPCVDGEAGVSLKGEYFLGNGLLTVGGEVGEVVLIVPLSVY